MTDTNNTILALTENMTETEVAKLYKERCPRKATHAKIMAKGASRIKYVSKEEVLCYYGVEATVEFGTVEKDKRDRVKTFTALPLNEPKKEATVKTSTGKELPADRVSEAAKSTLAYWKAKHGKDAYDEAAKWLELGERGDCTASEWEEYVTNEVEGNFVEIMEDLGVTAEELLSAVEASQKVSKSAAGKPVSEIEVTRKSTVKNPVQRVWEICEEMRSSRRKEVIAKCVDEGIAFYTARTQYQQWKAAGKSSN